MFREMRRPKQALSEGEIVEILKNCSTGVMAVNGDDGYPYAVPLNYTYDDGRILFHCAVVGHKLDSINSSDKVSFCVTEKEDVDAEAFNTDYKSVVVFGRAKVLTGDDDRKTALDKLVEKYSANFKEKAEQEIKDQWNRVAVVEIAIEKMTGKKGSGLV